MILPMQKTKRANIGLSRYASRHPWRGLKLLIEALNRFDEVCWRVTFAVAIEKNRGQHFAVFANDVGARLWQTLFVVNSKGTNRFAAGIGKQRVGQFRRLRELAENFNRIVADTNHLSACCRYQFEVFLQFDQLLTAEGSPICRTIKD